MSQRDSFAHQKIQFGKPESDNDDDTIIRVLDHSDTLGMYTALRALHQNQLRARDIRTLLLVAVTILLAVSTGSLVMFYHMTQANIPIVNHGPTSCTQQCKFKSQKPRTVIDIPMSEWSGQDISMGEFKMGRIPRMNAQEANDSPFDFCWKTRWCTYKKEYIQSLGTSPHVKSLESVLKNEL